MDVTSFRENCPACCYTCGYCHCKTKDNDYYYCNLHNEYITDEIDYAVRHICDDFA